MFTTSNVATLALKLKKQIMKLPDCTKTCKLFLICYYQTSIRLITAIKANNANETVMKMAFMKENYFCRSTKPAVNIVQYISKTDQLSAS